MASTFQLFLRGLDGRTSCLRFPSPIVTGSLIQEQIAACLRLPAASFLISTGTALVHPQTSLSADANGFFPSCSLSARLRGGKGGFGSLLRGAATKAGQKKTSNFDACRDMSGRRLRHVNAEKKLKEWKSQAKDRELEKAAREFLKKQTKRKEDDTGSSQLIEKFREETSKARENVESAVASGLAEARKFGKRKIADDDALPTSSSKQARLWYESNFDVIDDNLEIATDSSDDDDDNETSFEVIDANEGIGCLEGEETFEAKNDLENRDSEGLSPQGKIEEGIEQSETRNSQEINDTAIVENQCDLKSMCDNNVDTVAGGGKFESTAEETLSECHGNGAITTESLKSVGDSLSSNGSSVVDDVELHKAIGKKEQEICASLGPTKDSVLLLNTIEKIQETFSLDHFLHASDLEVLGLDRLKFELQTRGLKCGGSLSDRAGRLFLVKATPLEKLNKKHFAKARC